MVKGDFLMSDLAPSPMVNGASDPNEWRPLPSEAQAQLAARVAATLVADGGVELPPGPGGRIEIARDIDRLIRLARHWRRVGSPRSLVVLKEATCGRCSRRGDVTPCPLAGRGWCVLRDAAPAVAAALDRVLNEDDQAARFGKLRS